MMEVDMVPFTAGLSVNGPGGVMFSHTPTAGRFEQSPAITTGVPAATLEKDELWFEFEETEFFDELEELDKLTSEDELIDEDELAGKVDELTREDEIITDELDPTTELELVAAELEETFELVFATADEFVPPALSPDAPQAAKYIEIITNNNELNFIILISGLVIFRNHGNTIRHRPPVKFEE
jgi:hypothetical protein